MKSFDLDLILPVPRTFNKLVIIKKSLRHESHIITNSVSNDYVMKLLTELREKESTYEQWTRVGMALHHNNPTNVGLKQYIFFTKGVSYEFEDEVEAEKKWKSFKGSTSPVTFGTLIYLAKEKGIDVPKLQLEHDKKLFKKNRWSPYFVQNTVTGNFIADNFSDAVDGINEQGWLFIRDLKTTAYCRIEESKRVGPINLLRYTHDVFNRILAPYKATYESGESTKVKKASQVWLESGNKNQFDAIVFVPEGSEKDNELNLYKGFSIEEPINSSHKQILKLIKESLCNNEERLSEWLLDWLAHLIQEGWQKSSLIPVFITNPGAGKGILFDKVMREILGDYFVKISSSQLTSRFNDVLAHRFLVMIDEADLKKEELDRLKDLSGSDVMNYEIKHGPHVHVNNPARYVVSSNNKGALKLSANSRRFIVFEGNEKTTNSPTFFDPVIDEIENKNGAKSFAYFLKTRDISKFKAHKKPANVGQGFETILQTYGTVGDFWHDLLFINPKTVYLPGSGLLKSEVYKAYEDFVGDNENSLADSQFWKTSAQLIPILGRDNVVKRNQQRVRVKKVTIEDLIAHFKDKLRCPDDLFSELSQFKIDD